MVHENKDSVQADAARLLADARRAGRLPRRPSQATLVRIASIIGVQPVLARRIRPPRRRRSAA